MRSRPVLLASLGMILLVLQPFPAMAEAAAPAVKRIAVVLIQNGDTADERAKLADTGYFDDIFFGSNGSLAAWMDAVTFGELRYVPAGDGVFVTDPSDALRDSDPAQCQHNLARNTAEDHLAAQGVAWDHVAVVFDTSACNWGGLGQMPGKVTWYPPPPSLSAIVHEFGHNLGYPHETKLDCTGGDMSDCTESGYSGNTPMGSGGAGTGYSSAELLHSGLLNDGWYRRTTQPGSISLQPLYADPAVSGVRVVEFVANGTTSYLIETRARAGSVDSAVSYPGVRVYRITIDPDSGARDYRYAKMINPGVGGGTPYLPMGRSVTDKANQLTIAVRSSAASGAQVVIEKLGAKPSPTEKAQPTPSGPAPSASPSSIPSVPSNPSASKASPATGPGTPHAEIPLASSAPLGTARGWMIFLAGFGFLVLLADTTAVMVLREPRPAPRHRRRRHMPSTG